MTRRDEDFERRREIVRNMNARLSARVRYLKEDQRGVKEMCEAVEKYAREKAREAAKRLQRKLPGAAPFFSFKTV